VGSAYTWVSPDSYLSINDHNQHSQYTKVHTTTTEEDCLSIEVGPPASVHFSYPDTTFFSCHPELHLIILVFILKTTFLGQRYKKFGHIRSDALTDVAKFAAIHCVCEWQYVILLAHSQTNHDTNQGKCITTLSHVTTHVTVTSQLCSQSLVAIFQ